MTNTNAAMRAVILLAAFISACDGAGPLNGGATSGAEPDGSIAVHDAPDAASARPETAHADAGRAQPPPPPDVCAPFHLQYTGAGGAGPDDCPTVDCHCDGYSGPVPSALHGCLQSVDCAAACDSGDQWLTCAVYACASDADCGQFDAGKCIAFPGAKEGLCQGDVGAFSLCVDGADCPGGERCVVVETDGTRNCIDPSANDRGRCNLDADCPAGRCAFQGTAFVGVCTAGGAFAACFSDGDCAAGLRCRNSAGDMPGECSDGSDDAPCERDADCQVGVCAESVCSSGKVDDYCTKSTDCQSGFCAFGIRCSDGAVDAPCAHDDECASGRCAGNAAISACTAGVPSSKCVDDDDCVNGTCQHEAGEDVINNFGSCE
jgi:hypothetical protein